MHGDIKPENILVFKEDRAYRAKVGDFGCSTWFAEEHELLPVCGSQPWKAPEQYPNGCTLAQAQKMDVFSFGMLCLWLLFEEYLSGTVPLPAATHWAQRYFQGRKGKDLSRIVLDSLKQRDELVTLAQQFVVAEDALYDDEKMELQEFFGASLSCDPGKRKNCSQQSFKFLQRSHE